jgi:hypothetical protein
VRDVVGASTDKITGIDAKTPADCTPITSLTVVSVATKVPATAAFIGVSHHCGIRIDWSSVSATGQNLIAMAETKTTIPPTNQVLLS